MKNLPLISVVVLGYNEKEMTIRCLESVINAEGMLSDLIYVDNGSIDGSSEVIKSRFPGLRLVQIPKNIHYAGGMNAGIRHSTGDIIFCLNNDTIIDKNCIDEIKIAMQDESIGCANTKILKFGTKFLDMSICKLKYFNLIPYSVDYGFIDWGQCDNLTPDYANGCAMVLRREALNKVGLFDESYRLYWEDVDLSFRIKKAGYRIGFIPKAVVWHEGGKTTKKSPWEAKWYSNKNRIRFFLKYWGKL